MNGYDSGNVYDLAVTEKNVNIVLYWQRWTGSKWEGVIFSNIRLRTGCYLEKYANGDFSF